MKKPSEYINLFPREEKKEAPYLGKAFLILGLFSLAWLIVLGWQGYNLLEFRSRLNSLTIKKNAYQQQLATIYKELGITLPAGMSPEKAWLIQNILSERILWSEVFKQFSLIVPRGMWFDSLEGSSVGKAEIKIRGGAFNYAMIAEFLLALEKSPYFEKPQLMFAQKAVVQGKETVGFEIICGVKRMRGAQ